MMIKKGHILTYSGVLLDPANPDPDKIIIDDIVHALSNLCRYNGHVSKFYSVAEHSVHVSRLCAPEHALWGLLHDASEAYLCDIPRPIKPLLTNYYNLEHNLMDHIARKLGLTGAMPDAVKHIDRGMLLVERTALLPNSNGDGDWAQDENPPDLTGKVEIQCWTPERSRYEFWKRYIELTDANIVLPAYQG